MQVTLRRSALVLLLLSLGIQTTVAFGQASMEQIKEGWRKRHQALKGITYRAEGKAGVMKGVWTGIDADLADQSKAIPPEDFAADVSLEISLDMQGRAAKRTTQILYNSKSKRVELEHFQNLFDGIECQLVMPAKENRRLGADMGPYHPEIRVQEASSEDGFFDPNDFPVLMSLGIIASREYTGRPRDLPQFRVPSQIAIVGNGTIDGRDHLILRTSATAAGDSFYEFWVDPERDAAVSRFIFVVAGAPAIQCDSEFVLDQDHWLVDRWRTAWIGNGALETWREMSVTERVLNPTFDAAVFHVTPREGMIVQDDSTRRVVRKGSSPQEDQDIRRIQALERRNLSWFRGVWIIIGVGMLLTLVAVMRWYRRRLS